MFFKIKPKLVIATLFVLSLAFAVGTFAQGNIIQEYKSLYESKTPALENWGQANLKVTAVGVLDAMVNISSIPDDLLAGKILDDKGNRIVWIPNGSLGAANNLVASLQTPIASGVEYIAQVKDSLLGRPAYAQDNGAIGLQPILPLWRGFRNVVYILSSIVFITLGLMIMLRIKISPQAVITIQNAIPQLIIALILVTFSYAIAGLIIDLSYLIQAIVVAIFFNIQGRSITSNDSLFNDWYTVSGGSGLLLTTQIGNAIARLIQLLPGMNPFSFGNLSDPNFNNFTQMVYRAGPNFVSMMMLGGLVGNIILGSFLGGIGQSLAGAAGQSLAGSGGNFVGLIVGGMVGAVIVPIILAIILSIWIIKLWFGLIKAYVTIIFKIILAPLEIGMGAFPSSKMGFSSWLTDLIANISVFPIVNIYLILLNIVVEKVYLGGLMWAPNTLNVATGQSNLSPTIIAACIGLAGLSILARLPELVPALIFQLKNPWGQAIGQALQPSRDMQALGGMARHAAIQQGVGAAANAAGFTAGAPGGGAPPWKQAGYSLYEFGKNNKWW